LALRAHRGHLVCRGYSTLVPGSIAKLTHYPERLVVTERLEELRVVSSFSRPVMTRASALSCSIRAFCRSEFCRAFWWAVSAAS
jgi:hypothetical protein